MSGFYAWQTRPDSTHACRDRQLRVLIRASHEASRGAYGSPRLHRDLRDQGHRISRKRVIRLKQAEGLTARVRKRVKRTTMSDHDQPVAANLLAQKFVADAPNERWVGDTTEFVIGQSGKLYLAAILDLYSRFLVGWAVSAVNDRHLVIKALHMALTRGFGAWLLTLTSVGIVDRLVLWPRPAHDLRMKSRVHPKYKTTYRVGNWREYERALVQRGDVTLWLSADATDAWRPSPSGRPGGQSRIPAPHPFRSWCPT